MPGAADAQRLLAKIDKYKADTKYREIYNSVFMTLFGLTLESLHTLALKYDFKKEYNDISETMKELQSSECTNDTLYS